MKLNKIYQGNCLEVMKGFPGESIDLVVTSPPYGNLRKYDGYNFEFEGIARELTRILKYGGAIIWIVADQTISGSETGTSFKQALYFMNNCWLNLYDTMIYAKEGLTMKHRRYEQEFEYMFVFTKHNNSGNSPKTFNPIMVPCKWFGRDSDRTGQKLGIHDERLKKARSGKDRTNVKEMKIKGNIWKYNTGYGHSSKDKIAFEHPAIFPEKLARDHILSWSNKGDVVLDPMCGSGTTLKVAKQLGRSFIGIEISEKYIKIAEERLVQEHLGI